MVNGRKEEVLDEMAMNLYKFIYTLPPNDVHYIIHYSEDANVLEDIYEMQEQMALFASYHLNLRAFLGKDAKKKMVEFLSFHANHQGIKMMIDYENPVVESYDWNKVFPGDNTFALTQARLKKVRKKR